MLRALPHVVCGRATIMYCRVCPLSAHNAVRRRPCHSAAGMLLSKQQQVRFLRKLMPGKGFYMDVLCYLLKAWKRCAVPAAIASCCHESICAFVASRPALTRY